MAETTLEMIRHIDPNKFSSNVTKEYYDILRELISTILLLDGYKTIGDDAHKGMIKYLEKKYKQFSRKDIMLLDELRTVRNKISYDGFFVKGEYLERKTKDIENVLEKLKDTIIAKIQG